MKDKLIYTLNHVCKKVCLVLLTYTMLINAELEPKEEVATKAAMVSLLHS